MIPHQPPWMEVCWRELGTREIAGPQSNPAIERYHDSVALDGTDDDVAWCSSLVNWTFNQVGMDGTGSRAARSWLEWGVALTEPAYACVTVLWRGSPDSWKGHVGIFLGYIDDDIALWGGNQRNEVSVRRYPTVKVLGYRWPA
jgi:uncharacterized protein (TIGR02594 family)